MASTTANKRTVHQPDLEEIPEAYRQLRWSRMLTFLVLGTAIVVGVLLYQH